jgi:hypothetical protein
VTFTVRFKSVVRATWVVSRVYTLTNDRQVLIAPVMIFKFSFFFCRSQKAPVPPTGHFLAFKLNGRLSTRGTETVVRPPLLMSLRSVRVHTLLPIHPNPGLSPHTPPANQLLVFTRTTIFRSPVEECLWPLGRIAEALLVVPIGFAAKVVVETVYWMHSSVGMGHVVRKSTLTLLCAHAFSVVRYNECVY